MDVQTAFGELFEGVEMTYKEEMNERKLAMELGEYDCGQSDYDYEENENCNICHDILKNHNYGNVCKKHIPSYALWDNEIEDFPPPCIISNLEYEDIMNEMEIYIDYDNGYDSGYEDDMYLDEGADEW
jgi:hypothetical protein